MKVLLIGYGSIGKRHEEVLLQLNATIEIVTKQNLTNKKTFTNLKDINDLQKYDYFIIASETNKHFQQLKYLDKNVKNKKIFCEKPLFETDKILDIKNNHIFIGYVLRFHPLLQKLKRLLENETVISANIKCGQYLPTWRVNSDYKTSYSASKNKGGGVLLDLSHEIDYTQWLFGKLIDIKSYQVKISDLEIDSDDLTTMIGKTDKNIIINLSIDYISKLTHREMIIETLENTFRLNFIQNELISKNKNGNENIYTQKDLQRNEMFISMHKSILNNEDANCTLEEAKDIMKTITTIQRQNNE